VEIRSRETEGSCRPAIVLPTVAPLPDLATVHGEGTRSHGFRWEGHRGVEELRANSPAAKSGAGKTQGRSSS
jgi:hypothetical protein